ncbi:MAG TPA: ferrous iron transport protein A [Clostridiales bacterium]|jgi:ferrous iron transport protein A|nr:ferrous iron transport protein A [Clostridiales bacterium]
MSTISLNKLPTGQKGRVLHLKSDDTSRRRLLDLGIVVGTEIESLYKSPSGNPVAYFIRGAVIALREDVSDGILVSVS